VESLHRQRRLRRGDLELLSELYLTMQIEFSFCLLRYVTSVAAALTSRLFGMKGLDHGADVTVLENESPALASFPEGNINHRSGQIVSPESPGSGTAPEARDRLRATDGNGNSVPSEVPRGRCIAAAISGPPESGYVCE
jgi:hypothetical protein